MFWIGMLVGVFVGAWIGFLVLAMCVAAKRRSENHV